MRLFCADYRPLDELVPLLQRFNCGIEIQDYCNPDNFGSPTFAETLRTSIPGSVSLSMHGPFSELSPATRDKEIRRITSLRMAETLRIAKVLKAERVIFHSGFVPKTYPAKTWVGNSVAYWRELIETNDPSIDIHIENVYEDDWTILADLVDQINDPRVTVCLDIGHVNANSRHALTEWILNLNTRIGYVHLHNNFGTHDDHNGLMNGTVVMDETLHLLRQEAPGAMLSLETFAESPEVQMKWLRQNGFVQ